ncbi:fimbrial protein, partial [Salmonella enterica subsp. salamae]|nr:fimbrial protein [Salmonella enterica subsp. salamae]
LADARVTHLAAAYASAVSGFELRLPAEGTPAQWQAGLSVTVTVQ